jgi:hypothetical protein
MTTERSATRSDRFLVLRYVVAGLAMAAMVPIGFFYLSSGLVAPLWAVIALVAVWIGLVVVGIVWFRHHPLRLPALPVIAALLWFVVLTLGERLLGWTA